MTRLIWKEFRERRWWALAWAAIILCSSLGAHGQPFCRDHDWFFSPWQFLPWGLALLTGTGMYASELVRGQAMFLYSRPVAWWRVLLGKLIFGAVICWGVPMLAAVIFSACCPAEYRPFATLPHLAFGVWAVGWKMALWYLFGLGCSVLLPGLTGGLLSLICVVTIFFAIGLGAEIFLGHQFSNTPVPIFAVTEAISLVIGAWLAVVLGGLMVTRWGLTLEVSDRLKRFVPTTIGVLLGCSIIGLAMSTPLAERLLYRWKPISIQISPSKKYACVRSSSGLNLPGLTSNDLGALGYPIRERMQFIRLADHRVIYSVSQRTDELRKFPAFFGRSRWVSDRTFLCDTYHYGLIIHPDQGMTMPLTNGGYISSDFSPDGRFGYCDPSPNPHYRVHGKTTEDLVPQYSDICYIYFVNFDTGKICQVVLGAPYKDASVWWQSNDVVAIKGCKCDWHDGRRNYGIQTCYIHVPTSPQSWKGPYAKD